MIVKVLLTLGVLSAACLARPEDPEGTVATDGSCVASGSDGRCVPYYLCKEDHVTSDIIDIKYMTSPCTNYFDVCCQKEKILEKNP